jgi:hypothetical protein
MIKPKFDYNGNAFYDEIFTLALQGLTDGEIADDLSDRFGQSLSPEVFSRMKNGRYDGWSDKHNDKYSARICQVLARGRRKINSIVRGAYLKAAIGGKKVKSRVVAYAEQKCECGGDMDCEFCHGTGRIVSKKKSLIQESESEMAPNVQALSTWLLHHDPEWRKSERNEQNDDVPTDISEGVNIEAWIENQVKQGRTQE